MSRRVVIVGAGWAGLAAGVALARQGLQPRILEAGPNPGGRARRVELDGRPLDNGQHLLLGAYTAVLELIKTLGVDESEVLMRLPLDLELRSPRGFALRLRTPALPAPLHLAWGLLTADGLALSERLAALRGLPGLMRRSGGEDMSVSGLLRRHGQPPAVIERLWAPLCLGALNAPPDQASAAVFLQVLKEAFGGRRAASQLLIPRRDLEAVLPGPACAYLRRRGAELHLRAPVEALEVSGGHIRGVRSRAGRIEAETVILATGPRAARRLLSPLAGTADLVRDLDALAAAPITTVYLRYPPQTALPRPMLGLLDGPGQWVFDRRHSGQPGVMAVVISGEGPHDRLDKAALAAQVAGQLAALFPHWPAPADSRVIREKLATFRCRPGVERHRPEHRGPLPGLWLAGDYTDTGLPATLEGAVRSGLKCAQHVLAEIHRPSPTGTTTTP